MKSFLRRGWQRLRANRKAIVMLYLANLGTALLLAGPFFLVFNRQLGNGLYRQKLEHTLDYDWWRLFQERGGGLAGTFDPTILGAGPFLRNLELLLDGRLFSFPFPILLAAAAYLTLNAWLLGGAISAFVRFPGGGASAAEILRFGGRFFGRFLRLALISLVVYWTIDLWVVQPSAGLLADLTRTAASESPAAYGNLFRFLLLAGVFLVVNLVLDYTRIRTVLDDRRSVLLALFSVLRFLKENLPGAVLLYLVILSFGTVGLLIFLGILGGLPESGWLALAAAVALQQILIAGRIGLRLFYYSSQLEFLLQHDPLYQDRKE